MRLCGDGRLPFERSSCGESAFVAVDLEHPSALLLAKVGVDLGVGILSEYVGDLLERLQQSWASWGLRDRLDKANGFGDTGKLALVATVDASPNMNEFMCQDTKHFDNIIHKWIDEYLHGAIGTNGCVEGLA